MLFFVCSQEELFDPFSQKLVKNIFPHFGQSRKKMPPWQVTSGGMKSSLGCQREVLIHPSIPSGAKKPHFSKPALFYSIDNNNRESALAAFCYFISYTTHRTHIGALRGAKFGHEYQMFVQRGARESIRMAEFLYNSHTQNMYKRGEYYFRHVPEKQKGLRALIVKELFCLQARDALLC